MPSLTLIKAKLKILVCNAEFIQTHILPSNDAAYLRMFGMSIPPTFHGIPTHFEQYNTHHMLCSYTDPF